MTPSEAISRSSLKELNNRIGQLSWALATESDDIAEQWEALGSAGGQREDHAAMLLSRLRPALEELAGFAKECEEQLTAMVADPYGTKAA